MTKQKSGAEGLLYHPNTLSIHMTDICNSRCKFCSEASPEHMHDLVKKEEIIRFITEHDTSEWTELNIHGGEPTLSPSLIEVVHVAKNRGYKQIILQTNAHRIGMDEVFAEQLDKAGVDLYNIGFHGSNPEIMDFLTGIEGAFEKAIKGIKRIRGFHKPIRITSVVTRQNYKDLPSIVKLASEVGIHHVNISAMQTGGSAVVNLEILKVSYKEAAPYIREAVQLAEQLGIIVTLEGFPYCVTTGLEKYQLDWKAQNLKILYRKMVMNDYNQFLTKTIRTFGPQCDKCGKRDVCSGVYKEYINEYGWDEIISY